MNKWMPAGLGAEPKKVIFLGALLVLLPVIISGTKSHRLPWSQPLRGRRR